MTPEAPFRTPASDEVDSLARLWHDGWHEAHAALVTSEVLPFRTLEMFRARLPAMLPDIRVASDNGDPLGFCYVVDDEVDQMYVGAAARRTGLAARLLTDGEDRLRRNGFETAWLSCAVGNERAARFYEKNGWNSDRTPEVEELAAAPGLFVDVWRFSKRLA